MVIMKALFAASVLASLASAVPGVVRMDKRAVVMNKVTHTTWSTVDVTTIVYVNDADPTPPPQAPVSSEAVPTSAPAPPSSSAPAVSAGNFAPESAPPTAPPASSVATTPPLSTADVTSKAAGGVCQGQGSACTGDITYYNGGGGKLS